MSSQSIIEKESKKPVGLLKEKRRNLDQDSSDDSSQESVSKEKEDLEADDSDFAEKPMEYKESNSVSKNNKDISSLVSAGNDCVNRKSGKKHTLMNSERSFDKDLKKKTPSSFSTTGNSPLLNEMEDGDLKSSSDFVETVNFNSKLLGSAVSYALVQPFGDHNTSVMDAFTRRCTNCRKVGHDRRNCPYPKKDILKPDNIKRTCRNCNSRDHDRRTCPKKDSVSNSDDDKVASTSDPHPTAKDDDPIPSIQQDSPSILQENLNSKSHVSKPKQMSHHHQQQKIEDDIEGEWDQIRKQFSHGKERLRPKTIYSSFPYDMETLVWNSSHTFNSQQRYCYCGRSKLDQDISQKPMISCGSCRQLFHFECVNVLKSPLLCGDDSYHFRCAMCYEDAASENGEFFERTTQSWTNILRITLCNLLLRYAERGKRYFNITTDITRFVQKYWKIMSSETFIAVDLEQLLTKELNEQDLYFVKNVDGDWSLTVKGIPCCRSGIPLYIERVVQEETKRLSGKREGTAKCLAFEVGDVVLSLRNQLSWPALVLMGGAGRLQLRFLGLKDDEPKWIRAKLVEKYTSRPSEDLDDPDFQAALDEADEIVGTQAALKRRRKDDDLDLISDEDSFVSSEESHSIIRNSTERIRMMSSLTHVCHICHLSFKTIKSLENHHLKVHSEAFMTSEEVDDDLDEAARIVRNLDDSSSSRRSGGVDAPSSTTGSSSKRREFKCDLCDRSFLYNAGLVLHMRSHKRPPPATPVVATEYPCTICSRVFNRPQSLALHQKVHSKKRESVSTFVDQMEGIEANRGRVYADEVIGHEVYLWNALEDTWKKGIITSLDVEECKHRIDFSSPDSTSTTVHAEWYHLHEERLKWPNGIPLFSSHDDNNNDDENEDDDDDDSHQPLLSLFQASRVVSKSNSEKGGTKYLVELLSGDDERECQTAWIPKELIYTKKLFDTFEENCLDPMVAMKKEKDDSQDDETDED